jgi:hypothetical protein
VAFQITLGLGTQYDGAPSPITAAFARRASALAGDARFAAAAHAGELLDDRARVLRQAGRRQADELELRGRNTAGGRI